MFLSQVGRPFPFAGYASHAERGPFSPSPVVCAASCGGIANGAGAVVNGCYSTVSGGYCNTASGYNSTVSGGQGNVACGGNSTVSGGYCNTASGYNSTVSGGQGNVACGYNSTVSGGYCNSASGFYSTVSGGCGNAANGCYSTVSGGCGNSVSTSNGFVGSGSSNAVTGTAAAIASGVGNCAHGNCSGILSGHCNCSGGVSSSVLGGEFNCAPGIYSAVLGGYGVCARRNGQQAWGIGCFSAQGDAQAGSITMMARTKTNCGCAGLGCCCVACLTIDGTAYSGSSIFSVPPNAVIGYSIRAVATPEGNCCGCLSSVMVIEGLVTNKHAGGGLTNYVLRNCTCGCGNLVGVCCLTTAVSSTCGDSLDLVACGNVSVPAYAGCCIRWFAVVDITEVYSPSTA